MSLGLPHDVHPVRVAHADLEKLMEGVKVESVRFAKGVDGIFEVHVTGAGANPFPEGTEEPKVPVEPAEEPAPAAEAPDGEH